MSKNKFEFDVFFDIVDRKGTKLLVDNYGYICGVYRSFKEAKQAMKPIRRNIVAEFKKRKKLGKSLPNPVKLSRS